jgi:hypothetical protein
MTNGGGSYRRISNARLPLDADQYQPIAAKIAVQEIKAGNKIREV